LSGENKDGGKRIRKIKYNKAIHVSMLTWSGGGSGQSCQKSNNMIEAIVLVSLKMSGTLK
jgi:hypothetical protein